MTGSPCRSRGGLCIGAPHHCDIGDSAEAASCSAAMLHALGGGAGGEKGTDQYESLLGFELAVQSPLHLCEEVVHADHAEVHAGCGHGVEP